MKLLNIVVVKTQKIIKVKVDDDIYDELTEFHFEQNEKGEIYHSFVDDEDNSYSVPLHQYIKKMNLTKGQKNLKFKNSDSLDYRADNLLFLSYNRSKNRKKSSKYIGVSYIQKTKRYRVDIRAPESGEKIYLGCFDNEDDAAREYNKKAKELFGDLAGTEIELNAVQPIAPEKSKA